MELGWRSRSRVEGDGGGGGRADGRAGRLFLLQLQLQCLLICADVQGNTHPSAWERVSNK